MLAAAIPAGAKEHTLHVITTGDVHGSWFDRSYVDGSVPYSLMHVNHYVDSLRSAVGSENVLLLDAGDCLQGNNASYYYNYVARRASLPEARGLHGLRCDRGRQP